MSDSGDNGGDNLIYSRRLQEFHKRIVSNPWDASLEDLAEAAQGLDRIANTPIASYGGRGERHQMDADHLRHILSVRAPLEAAKDQRRTNRWLVLATWALVLVTIGLAVVTAIVAN